MFDRETVEAALRAVAGGMTHREAAALAGCSLRALDNWVAGRVPHERAARGRIRRGTRREEAPVDDSERAAYEAAMRENMLLRAVLADLKAGGWDPASISNARKAELGERLRAETGLPLRDVTGFLRISRSSYEYCRARLGRDRDAAIRGPVREAFEASGGAYGYRRVHAELARRGLRVSEKRVRRVMAEEGLEARRPRRRRAYSSYRGELGLRCAPNMLKVLGEPRRHDFSAARPGERAATDVTEFRLGGSGPKVYLSPVLDLFDGRVVSWAAGPSPSSELVSGMLRRALPALRRGCVLHSDRGWHYRTPAWVAACRSAGLVRSMSRKGCSPDNAACEGFFGRLKVEMFQGRDWDGWTADGFVAELGRYIEWYNGSRLKAFAGPGGTVYETIDGRRSRLGLSV